MWTLDDALELIRSLQPIVQDRFNFHITLGGGVLNKGRSTKDLDLCFLPIDNTKISRPQALEDFLGSIWTGKTVFHGEVEGYKEHSEEAGYLAKFKCARDDQRIDCFILGTKEIRAMET